MLLTNEQIAKALDVPLSRVQLYWPLLDECLQALCGTYGDEVCIAALATIRVECPPFMPIHEYGTDEQHEKLYGHRKDLGDAHDGDGAKFAGRGFIQITGELNYAHYGKLLGADFLADPDKTLEPNTAAAVFAAYFHERGCDSAARRQEWTRVRQIVNGGDNGLKAFLFYVAQLATVGNRADLAASATLQLKRAQQADEAKKAAAAGAGA